MLPDLKTFWYSIVVRKDGCSSCWKGAKWSMFRKMLSGEAWRGRIFKKEKTCFACELAAAWRPPRGKICSKRILSLWSCERQRSDRYRWRKRERAGGNFMTTSLEPLQCVWTSVLSLPYYFLCRVVGAEWLIFVTPRMPVEGALSFRYVLHTGVRKRFAADINWKETR